MDAAQWPQGIGVVKPVLEASKPATNEKKPRPPKEQALNCPRCNSTNTKFCYYNNYSLTQPRYFCKACRRYWTNGGSLRTVPVGGGSRKNKRSNSSLLSSSSSSPPLHKKPTPDLTTTPSFLPHLSQNPKILTTHQDLNLAAYPPYGNNLSNLLGLQQKPNSSTMEFLKNNGISSSRGLNISPFMPMPNIPDDCNAIYSSSGLPLHDFKPTLNFSLDGFENGYGNLHDNHHQQGGGGGGGVGGDNQDQTNAKLFFPMEDLKTVSNGEFDHHHHQQQQQNREEGDHHHHHQANGYWSGMLGGGSW